MGDVAFLCLNDDKKRTLKKSPLIKTVNENLLGTINPEKVEVEIQLMESESVKGIEDTELIRRNVEFCRQKEESKDGYGMP